MIDIKRGFMGNVILNQLYTHSQMESVMGCNMLVVDHNRPRVMNLPQILQAFLDHRFEVVTRRAQFELKKAEARAHILEGLLIAVNNIDEVVKIIRDSRTKEAAATALIDRFGLTRIQVNAILDMRLHQLTGLAIEDLQADYDEIMKQIAYLKELLASREMRIQLIKEELLYVKERYADKRRTEITYDDGDLDIADLIPRHSCVITVSDTGYIKRVPADTYQTQHRGGVGIVGMKTKDEDHVAHLFNADSHDIIFFFTDKGFMYWLNVYDIPEGVRTGNGKAIVNLIKIEPGEQIKAMLTLNKSMFDMENMSIVMATRNGVVKKTALSQFKNLRNVGLRALIIEEGDDLIGAELASGTDEVILSTAKGMACRFVETDIRSMGRAARGVTGIRFKIEDDYIVSMEVVPGENAEAALNAAPIDDDAELPADDAAEDVADDVNEDAADTDDDAETEEDNGTPQLLVVTSGGMGKRSYVDKYRLTRRGAKGVKNMNLDEGETVVAALRVKEDDELLITTERGQITRIPVSEIRKVGRNSKGVRIMNLRKNDRITSVSCIVQVEVENKPEETEEEKFVVKAGSGVDYAAQHFDENGEEIYEVEAEGSGEDADDAQD